MVILRWHVNRVYRKLDKKDMFDENKKPVKAWVKADLCYMKEDLDIDWEYLIKPDIEDNTDWWKLDSKYVDDFEYEEDEDGKRTPLKKKDKERLRNTSPWGVMVSEEDFFMTVYKYHQNRDKCLRYDSYEKRMIDEDMVFLQYISDDDEREKSHIIFHGGPLNKYIDSIFHHDGAKWIDFTLPARKMSKNVYQKALGIEIEDKKEVNLNASK